MIEIGRVNVVIDGQWGSTGKGKLVAWLCQQYPIDAVVCDFMPNAGHTWVSDAGAKTICTQVPVGAYVGVKDAVIGPHGALNVDKFLTEVERVPKSVRVSVHPLVPIVTDEHRAAEASGLNPIASTMKGSSEAVIAKMRRNPDHCVLACQVDALKPYVRDTYRLVQSLVHMGKTVLLEASQGFDLGLNHGTEWPFVTSRDCLVGRLFDNAGVSIKHAGSVIGSLRTFPIRVGNTEGGFSGPCYRDQQETDWLAISAGIKQHVEERTTVTNRVRRVFTFSFGQLHRFLQFVEPDSLFLNFVNYLPLSPGDWMAHPFVRQVAAVAEQYGSSLRLLGTGPMDSDMVVCDRRIAAVNGQYACNGKGQ